MEEYLYCEESNSGRMLIWCNNTNSYLSLRIYVMLLTLVNHLTPGSVDNSGIRYGNYLCGLRLKFSCGNCFILAYLWVNASWTERFVENKRDWYACISWMLVVEVFCTLGKMDFGLSILIVWLIWHVRNLLKHGKDAFFWALLSGFEFWMGETTCWMS